MSFLQRKMLMIAPPITVVPESVDLDGVNDYLSRPSDLVGNTNGKTFTFSCWVYVNFSSSVLYESFKDASNSFKLYVSSNALNLQFRVGGTQTLLYTSSVIARETFVSIIVSANTATGITQIAINDTLVSFTGSLTIDSLFQFVSTDHQVGPDSNKALKSRLSHIFLDHTYRDLSIEANRRLFITEDGKPADGQAALNPIMYLPMASPEDWHVNEGTGGDFTANGIVALSGRGPNQDNCVASEFDGVDDYLSTAVAIGAPSKNFTVSFVYSTVVVSAENFVILANSSGVLALNIYSAGTTLGMQLKNSAGAVILQMTKTVAVAVNSINAVSISGSMTNISTFKLIINGIDTAFIPPTYADSLIDFGTVDETRNRIGNSGIDYHDGVIGELYFDTAYIDLATENPFWDSDLNLPIPVRNVIENTGVTPLIAMPISADNPGLNLGTGGDFTVNGGPLVGARGASEFWARSAQQLVATATPTNYLSNAQVATDVAATGLAGVIAVNAENAAFLVSTILGVGSSTIFAINTTAAETIEFVVNATVLASAALVNATQYLIKFNYDGINMYLYVNGTQTTVACTGTIDLSGVAGIFNIAGATNDFEGDIGFIYLTDSNIDFSDESERLKFVDSLGYPVNIQPAIDAGDIPEPLIYMPFDEPDNLGKNNGTGGDFTVNGTVTQGADVDPS